jgi:hypothetical protein
MTVRLRPGGRNRLEKLEAEENLKEPTTVPVGSFFTLAIDSRNQERTFQFSSVVTSKKRSPADSISGRHVLAD